MNAPTPAWRSETDTDGIVWLSFDKPGTSTNVLSRDTVVELGGQTGGIDVCQAKVISAMQVPAQGDPNSPGSSGDENPAPVHDARA
jgi:hypothetical protein